MAEVILFRPIEKHAKVFHRFPLGLVYIAAPLIKKDYTVKIIDMETCPDWPTTLKDAVDSSTICAGVSAMTGYQIKGGLDFAQTLRKIRRIPVVWGGLHPSLLPLQTLNNEVVDIVVVGEGEEKFLRIVESLKNNASLQHIKGIMYKQNGQVQYTEPEENFLDMDKLPIPAYELIDFEYYSAQKRRFMGEKKRVIDFNPARGCPHRCAFCYNIKFNRRKWRMMGAENILDAVAEIKRRYNVDAINFVADNFFVDKDRVYNICKGIIDRKFDISWHSDIRIDTFLHYEDELVKLLKESGCTTLTFGVESGSNRMLKLIQKDITVEDVLKAHQKAKDFGFILNYHFMVGFPEETKKDIIETMKLIRTLKRDKNVTIYGPGTYVPYPGTPLYERCLELGFVPPNRLEDWIDYDFDELSKLTWFSKDFKNYLREIWYVFHATGEDNHGILINKTLTRTLSYNYYKLRHIGLIHNIRLFALEDKLSHFLIFLKKFFSHIFFEKTKVAKKYPPKSIDKITKGKIKRDIGVDKRFQWRDPRENC